MVTHDEEVVHTTLSLDISQEGIHVVLKERTCDVVVELKQGRSGDLSDFLLDNQEELTTINPIEG